MKRRLRLRCGRQAGGRRNTPGWGGVAAGYTRQLGEFVDAEVVLFSAGFEEVGKRPGRLHSLPLPNPPTHV